MAELRRPTDTALELSLHDLGASIAYPPTPPIAAQVRRRLETEPARPSLWSRLLPRHRRLALAGMALLFLVGMVLAASPSARGVVADRLGLRGVDITHLPFVPTPTPTSVLTASPAPPALVGERLGLGQPTTLEAAAARVQTPILRPMLPELGPPDEVYLPDGPPAGRVALVYRARAGFPAAAETGVGLLLIQLPGAVEPGFLAKGIGPDSRLEQLSVDGGRGFWIEGQPHFVLYRTSDGQVRDDQIRLAGNVLLWERGELTLRLEGAVDRGEALRIARSVR